MSEKNKKVEIKFSSLPANPGLIDTQTRAKIRRAESIAIWGFSSALQMPLVAGLGRLEIMVFWFVSYLVCLLIVREANKVIKKAITYNMMINMGQKAKGRFEVD